MAIFLSDLGEAPDRFTDLEKRVDELNNTNEMDLYFAIVENTDGVRYFSLWNGKENILSSVSRDEFVGFLKGIDWSKHNE